MKPTNQQKRDNVMGYGVAMIIGSILLALLGATTDLTISWWPLVLLLGVAIFVLAYLRD